MKWGKWMKLCKIVSASSALQKLIYQDLPLRPAYELSRLVDRLNPQLMFYSQEAAKAGLSDLRQEELLEFDIPSLDDISPITLPICDTIMLSAADIKNLEPFVVFDLEREFERENN